MRMRWRGWSRLKQAGWALVITGVLVLVVGRIARDAE